MAETQESDSVPAQPATPSTVRCSASWLRTWDGQTVELRCSREYLEIDGRHPGNHFDVTWREEWAE